MSRCGHPLALASFVYKFRQWAVYYDSSFDTIRRATIVGWFGLLEEQDSRHLCFIVDGYSNRTADTGAGVVLHSCCSWINRLADCQRARNQVLCVMEEQITLLAHTNDSGFNVVDSRTPPRRTSCDSDASNEWTTTVAAD